MTMIHRLESKGHITMYIYCITKQDAILKVIHNRPSWVTKYLERHNIKDHAYNCKTGKSSEYAIEILFVENGKYHRYEGKTLKGLIYGGDQRIIRYLDYISPKSWSNDTMNYLTCGLRRKSVTVENFYRAMQR